MMKTLFLILSLLASMGASAQKVSVLGDSYSTFEGRVLPVHNLVWYFPARHERRRTNNDVDSVGQTWWQRLADRHGMTIERNNSYSGSTVCQTGYNRDDYSDRSFFSRVYNLGRPDVILIFGGTNDSWSGAPVGGDVYEGWTNDTLHYFRPAFCHLLHLATTLYPKARIFNITNSELRDDITQAMDDVCRHYGVPNILLHDIEKQAGHPSQAGMRAIEEQVWEVISEKLKVKR